MEATRLDSLMRQRRTIRLLIDQSLERLRTLSFFDEDFLRHHQGNIDSRMEELERLDRDIISLSPSGEAEEVANDHFAYRSTVFLSLRDLRSSLKREDKVPHEPAPTLPKQVLGYVLAKPKITCPTFDGLDQGNKFALRDFLTKFDFYTAGLHDDRERLICLKTYVSGRPFHLIHRLSDSEWNYRTAVDILKKEYWDKDAIREEIFEKIIKCQPKVDKNYDALREYVAQVQYELRELDADYEFILCHTGDVIKALLRVGRTPAVRIDASERFRPRAGTPWNKSTQGGTTEGFHADLDIESPQFCNFCAYNGHSSVDCRVFPNYGERLRRCKRLGLCERCSEANHLSSACPIDRDWKARCRVCHVRGHLSVLCPELKLEEPGVSTNVISNAGITHNILPMIKTTIRRGEYSVSMTCLLDSGSQRSYFAGEVLDCLHCDPDALEYVELDVVSFVGRKRRRCKELTAVVKLFSGATLQVPIFIDSQLDLTHKVPDLPLVWENLRNLELNLTTEITSGCVRLWGLMGVDILQHLYPIRVVQCMQGTAWETPVGVMPIGDVRHFLNEDQIRTNTVNQDFDLIVEQFPCDDTLVNNALNPCPSYIDPFADVFEDSQVDRGLEWMFSLESLGLPESELDSNYDKGKLEEFMENIAIKEGHYSIKLPWYEDKLKRVQSNHHVAIKVLDRVVKDLEKRGVYDEYLRVFEEQEESIIEPVACSLEDYKDYVWIPHRPVFKNDPTSTTGIRPVFNCSFKTRNSYSLNDAAYNGINLTGDMLNLTLRFRSNKYVFMADIRRAFLMVRLAEESDRNRFCFFLKRDNKLKCYRYATIIFGFSASPFILNCILKYHASRFPMDPCTDMLLSNFYVDNLIRTDNNLENLISLYYEAVERLQEGGFSLQACNSNNATLQESMKKDETYVKHNCPWEKILGYRYHPSEDVITIAPYVCDLEARTKRQILSEASKLFDPLSLCLPVTIQARTFISELWKMGLGWDERVPVEQQKEWAAIARELSEVASINFPRRAIDEGEEANLFLFCDASKKAYGFTAYAARQGASSLVFAKAKVAPLKSRTLPTLELLAAFLAIKCLPTLLRSLSRIRLKTITLAIDAQIVLSWLISKNNNNKNVFAKNKLIDIARYEGELISEFGVHLIYKYVPSDQNPADLVTRSLSTAKLKANLCYWIHGPLWMRDQAVPWPENALNCLSPENKRMVTSVCYTVFIRFTNLYGIPSHIYSDNAKSFVAGCSVIHQAFTCSEFKERFGTCEIKHHKIPLHSPWYGSVWERLIRTVKSCLYKLIGWATYNYNDLLTILSDVQRAVNDRPLTYRSSSDQGLEILTPNHFLHPVLNPRLIFRIAQDDVSQVEPPSRRHLVESLRHRDEALKRF